MGNLIGLGVAWYLLPYCWEQAHELYAAAVQSLGLRDEDWDAKSRAPVLAMAVVFHQLALVLALEFGDDVVAGRLKGALDVIAEPKHFGDGDFGFFYNLGEAWPRGQLSALLMVSEVSGPGHWRRVFSNPGFRARFRAPAVEAVDFPRLGIAQAWNDSTSGTLTVKTYTATPSLAGQETSFRLVRVPAGQHARIERDGQIFSNWAWSNGAILVRTQLAEHTFVVHTGYHGPTGVKVAPVARGQPHSRL